MVVETAKNQIILNQIVGQKKENRQVEADVIVNDIKPDVLNVITTNGVVNIYKKEVMEGKIRVDGTISTYIVYIADDEQAQVRSLNTSLDFTQIIDMENAKEGMDAQVKVAVKSFDTRMMNGRKLNVKANLEISANISSNESFEIVTGIENLNNIQLLNNRQKITSLIGNGTNKTVAKDTIAIDTADDLVEIMKVNFKIVDEETKISYNKVLSKADAMIEIMYLTEDNRINKVTTKIPIMGFVDIQNVAENSECEVQNNLVNLVVKPNSREEHSISIEAEIEIVCFAYETKEIDIIEDVYSITKDISFTKTEINAVTERNRIGDIYTLQENIRMPELEGNVLDIQINPSITNTQVRNSKIIYEGNLNLEILFEQNNGINLRTVDLPFNFDVSSNKIEEKSSIETMLEIKQNDFIVKDGTIGITIGIKFNISEQKNKVLNMIKEVNMEEETNCNTYSMVIYFVKPNDTLWKIAKMFKSTIEDIVKINNIEDVNKIKIGQQLYIPRFCRNKTIV